MNLIKMLFKKKKIEPFIGELYCGWFSGMSFSCYCPITTACGPGQRIWINFYKIKMSDIEEIGRNEIKFYGDWYSLDDFIFNGEESKKEEIVKRYEQ